MSEMEKIGMKLNPSDDLPTIETEGAGKRRSQMVEIAAITGMLAFGGHQCAAAAQSAPRCPPRGMEIPALVPSQKGNSIPAWSGLGEGFLRKAGEASYGWEIVTRDQVDCMVLDLMRPDRSRVIKDSVNITRFHRNPGAPSTQLSYCYPLQSGGRIDRNVDGFILAFTLPEKGLEGCTHYSRRIRGAWRIDYDEERFVPVSTNGLICDRPESGYGCYDCKRYKDGLHCK